jgi:hypothetical protein
MKLTYYGDGSNATFSTPNSVGYGAVVYSSNPAYTPVIASQSTSNVVLTVAPPLNTKIKILYDNTPAEYVSGTVEWRKNSSGVLDAIQKPDGTLLRLDIDMSALNVTGDGTAADTARIQAAIDYAQEFDLPVRFEAGKTYKLYTSLTFKHGQSSTDSRKYNVRIIGNNAVLYPVGSATAIHIQPRCDFADRATGRGEADIQIESLWIDGFFGASTAKALIIGANGKWCSNLEWSRIDDVTVANFTADHNVVELFETRHHIFRGLAVRAGSVAIAANTTSSFCGDMVFDACEFSGTPSCRPLNISASGAAAQLRGITFSACDIYGAGSLISSTGAAALIADIWFDNGCQFDGPDTTAGQIALTISATGTAGIVQIHLLSAYYVGFKAAAVYAVSSSSGAIYQLTIQGGGVGTHTGHADSGQSVFYMSQVESVSIRDVEFDSVDADQLINCEGCTNVLVHDNKATRCTASNYLITIGGGDKHSILGNVANVATGVVNDYTSGSPTRQVANNLLV